MVNYLSMEDIINDLKDVKVSSIVKWVSKGIIKRSKKNKKILVHPATYANWKAKEYPQVYERYMRRINATQNYKMSLRDLERRCKAITGRKIDGGILREWVYSRLENNASIGAATELMESSECLTLVTEVSKQLKEAKLKYIQKEKVKQRLQNKYSKPRPCGLLIQDKKGSRCLKGSRCPYYTTCLDYAISRRWGGWTEIVK